MVQKRLPMLPASSLCRWRTESGVAKEITRPCRQGKRDMGGWWLVVGGWWLVVGGWWLVYSITDNPTPTTASQTADVKILVPHQRENRGLRDNEKSIALERDLDCGFAEKERVVADLGLHGN